MVIFSFTFRMTEVKQGHVYTDNLKVLEKIMGVMFNNVKFSDTVFTVKEQKFYALSQLLAASSTTLDSMITEHYEHCDDKDITLHNVKHGDSFMIILKYMYGLRIDFSEINIPVLCEVLSLSNAYQLVDFTKDVKDYLSKMDHYKLESAVVLLNTANKYDIPELYDHVTTFAYENSDELVKHESFQDLGYNVLTDLLKSDWFCCSEIDILKGVLTWHSDMDKERIKVKETLEKKNVVEDEDEKSDIAEHPDSATDLADIQLDDKEGLQREQIDEKGECSNINNDSEEKKPTLSGKTNTCTEVMETFSDNILKSLLTLIRSSRISILDMFKALKTEPFKKYSHFLLNETYYNLLTQNCEPRQKYQQNNGGLQSLTTMTFSSMVTVEHDILYESEEEHLFGNLKWKICFMCTSIDSSTDCVRRSYSMYLKSTSDNENDWACTVECQLKWISRDNRYKNLILPDDNSYTTLTLTRDTSCLKIGKWEWEFGAFTADWWKAFRPNHIHMFCLDIKSMQTKMMQ
uniref:BTB/POZ domain-containing protein 9 n=1 Tax=Cacopsylla melanoneura TaxID=428564 RepID=A0A8D8RUL7_9HEMI